MKWSCTLCGSRDWPSRNTTCPLCRNYSDGQEPTDEPFGREDWIDEPNEPDNALAPTKTQTINHEPTAVLPKLSSH